MKHELKVDGMTCGGCANSVKNSLQSADPQASVQVDLNAKTVTVESKLSKDQLTELISDLGFEVMQG